MNPNYTGRLDTLNTTTDPNNQPTLYVCGSKKIYINLIFYFIKHAAMTTK